MNDAANRDGSTPANPTFPDATNGGQSGHDRWVWVATGLGIGFLPWAPGTFGTLWGLPLAWGINQVPSLGLQIAIIVAVCLVGIPICQRGAAALGQKDPGSVVWDEIAAVPITFFMVPAARMSSIGVLFAGFLLFRFFDITKIPPAKQLDRCPGGWGIMADDCVAGVYSCACLHLLLRLNLLP